MRGIPILFICFIIFLLWFRQKNRQSSADAEEIDAQFWNREREANFIRKKDISNLPLIQVPMDQLPFGASKNAAVLDIEKDVRKDAEKKMINLSDKSNTDLKMEYGTANLEILSEYDANATVLLRHISRWGTLLFEEEDFADAKTVLEYGISIGTDISANYINLAKIYIAEGNISAIQELLDSAQNLNTLMKNSIIAELRTIMSSYQ